jgi:hypothetical protein
MSPELGRRVVHDSLKLVRALGYDMDSMEWAVKDGVPYAIDFMNPAPDMDIYSLTPHYFEWAVNAMADLAISLAKNPQRRQIRDFRWDQLFAASREGGDGPGNNVRSSDASGGGLIGSGTASAADASTGGLIGSGTRSAADASTGGLIGSGTHSATDAAAGEDNGGYMGSGLEVPAAASSGGPISERGESVVDASPAADLEPPTEAPAGGASPSPEDHAASGSAGGHNRTGGYGAAPEEGGRQGEDTAPEEASRSAGEEA